MEQVDFEQLGAKLKEAREKKNISLEEISSKTRINIEFLKKFEQGIFDFLPEFYVRHFLKSYLKCIDKRAFRLLEDYKQLQQQIQELEQQEAELNELKTSQKIQHIFKFVGIKRIIALKSHLMK